MTHTVTFGGRGRWRRVGAVAGLLLGAAGAGVAALLLAAGKPSATRPWAPDHAHPARATFDGTRAVVRGIRAFRYDAAGLVTAEAAYDAVFDLDSIETAWFILTSFSRTTRAPAHTFVSFGFAGGRYVAISIEARRETDEAYGIMAGLLRRYELVYVIGDERDLIGRRAAVEGDDTYLFPVRAPRARIAELFAAMLRRANAVQDAPEFYNSIFNSCASNLVTHVNAVSPGRIPSGWKVLVPGYADDVAQALGLIAAGDDATDRRRRFRINERARAALASEDFSGRLRTP